jgi:hypothetical protein
MPAFELTLAHPPHTPTQMQIPSHPQTTHTHPIVARNNTVWVRLFIFFYFVFNAAFIVPLSQDFDMKSYIGRGAFCKVYLKQAHIFVS